MKMDNARFEKAISDLQQGLAKYQKIMRRFHEVNVKEDEEFQNDYKKFYGFRHPNVKDFSNGFFNLLEDNKNKALEYPDVLKYLETFGRLEASFASKLIATIDPNKPIIDQYVLKNIGLKLPYTYAKDRFNKTVKLYDDVSDWYSTYLKTDDAKKMIQCFDQVYPNAEITKIKKIDLILWQTR
jgi:Ca2+-binding EF-hand superfamily protein